MLLWCWLLLLMLLADACCLRGGTKERMLRKRCLAEDALEGVQEEEKVYGKGCQGKDA